MEIEYEMDAKRGKAMPENLGVIDQGCFQAISCLTKRYRLGGITADECKTEMLKIRRAYEKARLEEADAIRVGKFWAGVEDAGIGYLKTRSDHSKSAEEVIKAADALWSAVYGLIPSLQKAEKAYKDAGGQL